MKLAAAVISLFITATASLPASAAISTPLSASLGEVAAAVPVEAVQHRQRAQRRAPARRYDGYGAYGAYGYGRFPPSYGWSRSYHPGWPCVGGDRSDNSSLSAYPSWEVRPYCR